MTSFGCGAHGTAISFVMEYQGLGFVEAVEELARSAGMTVPQEVSGEKQRPSQSTELAELMLQATRYYREQLKRAPQAIEYLKQRGLTGAEGVAEAFEGRRAVIVTGGHPGGPPRPGRRRPTPPRRRR